VKHLGLFLETAMERRRILARREDGQPKPWTLNPVFQQWRFCNVHREHDRTTKWFAENVRSKLQGLDAVFATIAFRWFNRVDETGLQLLDMLLSGFAGWDSEAARGRLQNCSPLVTGAYVIKTPDGMSKLDGILWCLDQAHQRLMNNGYLLGLPTDSLEDAHKVLLQFPYLGKFMAYEVVTDLRWTNVLRNARDVLTWASAGPGCARGLGWVVYGDPDQFNYNSRADQGRMLVHMGDLLKVARTCWSRAFPGETWEMREVEHWLCEFDKYMRALGGERLKRRFE